ncbi:MAG: 1-acyl-sn-glycerol-3-phosphate acyltransferase [Verrucomicrobia bacterium]|nr:1-acyl-sn-glycerol-3-phosphate acyltransferase [Verrucomicrobiota bacterium]
MALDIQPPPKHQEGVREWMGFRRMDPIYILTWLSTRTFFTLGFHTRHLHPERIPADGPVILAANHASFFDPPLVGCGLDRPVNFLARESLFNNAFFGWYLRKVHCVPVDRDGAGAAGLKGILDRLQAGGVILLFPEGTRTSNGILQPARSGVGLTAIKSKAPVIPVRLFGTFSAFSRHQKLPRFLASLTVKYGKPVQLGALHAEAATASKQRLKQIYQEASNAIMKDIASLEPCEDVASFP